MPVNETAGERRMGECRFVIFVHAITMNLTWKIAYVLDVGHVSAAIVWKIQGLIQPVRFAIWLRRPPPYLTVAETALAEAGHEKFQTQCGACLIFETTTDAEGVIRVSMGFHIIERMLMCCAFAWTERRRPTRSVLIVLMCRPYSGMCGT
jgi:hypothetical protein